MGGREETECDWVSVVAKEEVLARIAALREWCARQGVRCECEPECCEEVWEYVTVSKRPFGSRVYCSRVGDRLYCRGEGDVWWEVKKVVLHEEPECCEVPVRPAKARIRVIDERLVDQVRDIQYVRKMLACNIAEAIEVIRLAYGS